MKATISMLFFFVKTAQSLKKIAAKRIAPISPERFSNVRAVKHSFYPVPSRFFLTLHDS
jgi:hypothetical protein